MNPRYSQLESFERARIITFFDWMTEVYLWTRRTAGGHQP
jgi:hypothetical protein